MRYLLLVLLLQGCSVVKAFDLDHDFECKGKATILGGGSGFSGVNGTIDCGEGFSFKSGTSKSPGLVK